MVSERESERPVGLGWARGGVRGGKGWVRGGEVGEGRITAFRSVLSGSGLVKFIGIFKIFSFLNILFSLTVQLFLGLIGLNNVKLY